MRRLLLLLLLTACGGSQSMMMKKCTTTSCSGCCTDDDRCVVEVRERDTYCGFNGSSCINCLAMGKTCSTMTLNCQ